MGTCMVRAASFLASALPNILITSASPPYHHYLLIRPNIGNVKGPLAQDYSIQTIILSTEQ
jgi:hypothetical protein